MDNLDRIAWLRALIAILTDLAPDGEWKEHHLLQKWRTNHYSLTQREMRELCNYLDSQRRIAQLSLCDRKYKQLDLMDEEGDRHE